MPVRILLAEDDRDLARAVCAILKRSGYQAEHADNGDDALQMAMTEEYDGIILDWMMPGQDGIAVLRNLRQKGVRTPCMMLTARETVNDRIAGLDAGADDYLPKPFDMGELLARIRAMLRRGENWQGNTVTVGNTTLDRGSMEIICGTRRERLNTKAFGTLELLMDNPGMVFSAERIMDRVWGWDSDAEINVVWVNVSGLRKKLAEIGSDLTITAIRGSGYVLEAEK